MYLVAVTVQQLSRTSDASSATVRQHHLQMVVHRLGVFPKAEQPTDLVGAWCDWAKYSGATATGGDLVFG